ncbi:MAG: hypothetical protein DMD26_18825 [Gemmatimonadetes bacterium]|nr:MAG: hypothetical protein DMD26_18825 [Gemmatimonadota bacterium]
MVLADLFALAIGRFRAPIPAPNTMMLRVLFFLVAMVPAPTATLLIVRFGPWRGRSSLSDTRRLALPLRAGSSMEDGRPHFVDSAMHVAGVLAAGIDGLAVVANGLVRALRTCRGGKRDDECNGGTNQGTGD